MSFMTERYFQILESHRLYERIFDDYSLRVFMEHHVICVWSYHELLRSIYRELVNSLQPLNTQVQKEALRLVSEIILEEEVDEQGDGSILSQLEVYLEAMQEVGADIGPAVSFFDLQENGLDGVTALKQARFPAEATRYARRLSRYLAQPLHERAAVLFYEGEPYIPSSFLQQLSNLSPRVSIHRLLDYFERHIEGLKRPGFSAIGRLVEIFCGDDESLNLAAEQAAESVMKTRIDLWNHLAAELQALPPSSVASRPALKLVTGASS